MALDFEFPAREDPDWGGARTKRAVLMTPSAEWVQSLFSCQFELNGRKLIAPNRDFPYEGLLACLGGEHWKFIDCIAVAVESESDGYLSFVQNPSAPSVRVNPWSVTYQYQCMIPRAGREPAGLPFSVAYRLHSVCSPEIVTGSIEIAFPDGLVAGGCRVRPTVMPFVDVRHMYGSTELGHYGIRIHPCGVENHAGSGAVSVTGRDRTVSFHFRGGEIEQFASPEILHWHYKLGAGERTESSDSAAGRCTTMFVSEAKVVTAFFCYRPDFDRGERRTVFYFECRPDAGPHVTSCVALERLRQESIEKDDARAREVQDLFKIRGGDSLREAILGRIVGLTKFKTFVRNDRAAAGWTMVPHAGAWWFHTPWFRDVFEGLLSSLRTLMTFPDERDSVKEVVRFALSLQNDDSGLIPGRVPEFRHQKIEYNSSDASLLCILVAEAYLRAIWEPALAMEVAAAAMKIIARVAQSGGILHQDVRPDDPPRLDDRTGLLLTAAHHSWIDTRKLCVEYAGRCFGCLPNRFSSEFVKTLGSHLEGNRPVWPTFISPCFFLPEVNAQWIKMLQGVGWVVRTLLASDGLPCIAVDELQRFQNTVTAIRGRAEGSYQDVFWNDEAGYPFNVVYEDRLVKDAIECETGVTAAVMLGEPVFTRGQLRSVWECVRQRLLVSRKRGSDGWAGECRPNEIDWAREWRCGNMRPFGILAKNEPDRTFYGDGQYHGSVAWLRSTHYLVMLLRMLGERELARDAILNVLDHQMSEGAVFYNQELFSLPIGNNPRSREAIAENPVPVKNPIQFWSQWCDQVMEEFGGVNADAGKHGADIGDR